MYCLKNYFYFNYSDTIVNIYKYKHIKLYNKQLMFDYNFVYSFSLNFLIIKKYSFLLFRNYNNYYYNFNKINNLLFLNFFKNLNFFLYNDSNLLFLDSNYKFISPLLTYFYGAKTIDKEKNFFFVKKNYITRFNYITFFKIFLKKNNIRSLVILDYNYFKVFFSMFLKLECALYSVIGGNDSDVYCDFFFYSSLNNIKLVKIMVYNVITSAIFYYYNLKNIFFKKLYYQKFNLMIKNRITHKPQPNLHINNN